MAARYAKSLEDGYPATAPSYLWRYAYRHAAAAGPSGLTALRALATDAAELRPDIALGALEVANVSAGWGRRAEAVPPTEEAVTLYRELAADNPAYAPSLAMALTNLGIRYGEVGRRAEAVPPTEEAVTLYRELAADNPAYAPDLAAALTNLGDRHTEVGERSRGQLVWQEVLTEQDASTRAILLYLRAVDADLGDPGTAGWLVEVCRSDDRGLLAAAHDLARRARAIDPSRWDAAWTEASGSPPPVWLVVDSDLVTAATAWVDTSTYEAERDHLVVCLGIS